jgi:hypothetical protein
MRALIRVTPLLVAAACATNPAPVPLVADPEGKRLLAGEWVGEYSSPETGRVGSIAFSLVQHDTGACGIHAEHAHGDVLMIPRESPDAGRTANGEYQTVEGAPSPQVLRIDLMRVVGDHLTGTIEPYRDPETGYAVSTTFEGTITQDFIVGEFVTVNARTGDHLAGTWTVKRKKEKT